MDSDLVNYTDWSPNYTKMSGKKVDAIVIHHAAGILSVETFGKIMQNTGNNRGSANYAIGSDGRIGQYVAESDRAWTTGSALIDNHAVTIECSNSTLAPDWRVSDIVLRRCIDLCIDVCRRNGIKRINYTGDKSGNLHMHKWWAATACPGPYLSDMFPYIADEINKGLGGGYMTLDKGWNEIEYAGIKFTVIKGYGDYKQLHMMSAVGDVPGMAVQDIKHFDSKDMLILGYANANYFEMNKDNYGMHYGTEQSEGDGIHSLGNDFIDPKDGVLVFYQKKNGTCGYCKGSQYGLKKSDVIFACTPYSVRYHHGKAVNERSLNLGNKELTNTKQTGYCMTADGTWHIIVSQGSCTPQTVADLMGSIGAYEGFICDGGGSSQVVYIGKAYIYTGRQIPNILALACYKDAVKEDKPELPSEETDSTVADLQNQNKKLEQEIQGYRMRIEKAIAVLKEDL